MAKKFLTLNIGYSAIALAEYESSGASLTMVNYGTASLAAPLDAGNADTVLSPALLEIVREKGIKPGPVAVSLSGQMVFPRFAAIPFAGSDQGKFDQLVRYEIEQNIPFPIDEMICDRQVLGDTANGDKAVLIVAAKTEQVEAITDAVQAAGFQPMLVDAAPIAVTNALKANRGDEGCVMVLDIGAKTASLIIAEDEKLYNRSIPIAGNTITKEIAQALGCTLEEAEGIKRESAYVSMGGVTEDADPEADCISKVCRAVLTRLNAEISRSINFYRSQQGGSAPSRLLLTGGTALLPQIDTFFAESLGIEVAFFNPFERIAVGPKVDAAALEADGALIAATAGVALHCAGVSRFTVNLLPPSLVAERAEKAKIPFVAAAGVAFVAGLVLVMLAVNRDTAVIEAQREAVQGKVTQLESFDKRVQKAETELADELAAAQAVGDQLYGRSVSLQRLMAVRSSLQAGMWIEKWEPGRISVRYWKDRVAAKGGKTVGEQVVEKLKGKPAVDPASVKIADMRAIGKDGQVEQVTIEVKFR